MGLEIYYIYEFTSVVTQILLLLQEIRKFKQTDPKETNFTKKVFGTMQTPIILVSSYVLHLSNLQATEKKVVTSETRPAFNRMT